jgi:hypothetical protein
MRLALAALFVIATAMPARAGQAADLPAPVPERGGSSRVIWGPTGRLLAPGETTVTTYQLFVVPAVQVGITSRLQLGIGAPIYRGVLIAPKVKVYSRGGSDRSSLRTDIAAGVAHAWLPGIGGGGYAYVATTYGAIDAAVTLTGGMYYDSSGATKPVLAVGGERRLSPRVVWITDNHFTSDGVLAAGGFRLTGPNKSVDFVLGWLITEHGVAPLPMLNVGWKY